MSIVTQPPLHSKLKPITPQPTVTREEAITQQIQNRNQISEYAQQLSEAKLEGQKAEAHTRGIISWVRRNPTDTLYTLADGTIVTSGTAPELLRNDIQNINQTKESIRQGFNDLHEASRQLDEHGKTLYSAPILKIDRGRKVKVMDEKDITPETSGQALGGALNIGGDITNIVTGVTLDWLPKTTANLIGS